MPFYELSLSVASEQSTSLEELLTDLGAVGITYRDNTETPIYEPLPGDMPLWNQVRLTALFDQKKSLEQAHRLLSSQLPQAEVIRTRLKEAVWERMWMDHFNPMQFGQNSWVIPDGFDAPAPDAINLVLDPGLAFGTGTHATTALCLDWLDCHDVRGQDWVDFGCGSGILAIMALLHGARRVICVDIDDQAIEASILNARKNNVEDGIEVVSPHDVESIVRQDGILANILAGPLMQLRSQFASMLKPAGQIVLSGILAEQQSSLTREYAQSFIDIECENLDDWVRVSARLPQ